jgi:hypothetical protein
LRVLELEISFFVTTDRRNLAIGKSWEIVSLIF